MKVSVTVNLGLKVVLTGIFYLLGYPPSWSLQVKQKAAEELQHCNNYVKNTASDVAAL